ncbi:MULTISPECIES: FKBP-type peptidyl-prolyl cis-trans isomerase [Arsenicicoccus]|uniref:FKBP-type peptidyl-prolyl cis-trans isomerase n=2 Tax=Intrasporangiaceae TaxID=85021 RepID=UPI00257FA385|nr:MULTISPECIES: FKBP-type peptidyl-prolyl cis-trans isomerase [Arsenicicoccus]
MRLRTSSALALAAVPAIALSACGSGGASTTTSTTTTPAPSPSAPATPASATPPPITPAAKGDLAGITVGGTPAKPSLKVDKAPFTTKETTTKVVTEGTGQVVKKTDMVVANALFVSGKTGKTLEDTFAANQPQQIPVNQWIPGVAKGMLGQKVGSRMLIAMAPADAATLIAQGNPQSGLAADETLVAYVEIQKVGFKGEACKVVTSKEGLPEVTAADGKAATMKPTTAAAPKQATAYVLKEGTGPVVNAGQTLSSHYTGMLWTNGTKFDSSYDHGAEPTPFPIGVGQVIPAWDKCLTGQKVGSRVLVVAPPAEAYGAKAQDKIPANSTLVFVVDLVKAQ